MKKLKQAYGNWVSGDRFWGREEDLRLLEQKIHEGAHTLLIAQRRMGKTSLMKELQERLKDQYLCIFIDLQKAESSEDAIAEISDKLKEHEGYWKKIKGIFANFLQAIPETIEELGIGDIRLKIRAGLNSANWTQKGDDLFFILAEAQKPVLLLMDEVPIMVNRMIMGEDFKITENSRRKADLFMSWLRQNSLKHQGKIRIILSGSIGLEPVLRRAGLSASINNFHPFDLKPWDEKTAVECLRALANEYGILFQDQAEEEMIRQLEYCIPHHVQMFFSHVRDVCTRRGRMEFFRDEVAGIYETEMLSIHGQTELSHYEERLRMVLGLDHYRFALELLTETAVVGFLKFEEAQAIQRQCSGINFETKKILDDIFQVLQHDGYLKQGAHGFVFQSPLLKDWWKRRYSFSYIPASKRGI